MANVKKRNTKSDSYQITVSTGYNTKGKQIRRTMTFVPDEKMTERQKEKAVAEAAVDFERSVKLGYRLDDSQTFAEYAEYVLSLRQANGTLKQKTVERYRELLERTNQAIGHLKLKDIRPQHLNEFYKNLSEDGIRQDRDTALPRVDFPALLKRRGMTRAALARSAGVSASTVSVICKGQLIRRSCAEKIAQALDRPVTELFRLPPSTGRLSPKTVREHHVLISSILAQAEKEMLVPYNAAEKASPPRIPHKEPNYFQPEEISEILDALEEEPLLWRAITNLLIVTGCRRGEIMGLKWEKVDLEKRRIRIDSALLIAKDGSLYETTTKTEDCRFLNIPAETVLLLRQWKNEQTRARLMSGDRWTDTGFVFTTDRGLPVRPDSITAWLSDFSKRHGLPHINPHAFRHTVASVLISQGTDVVTVARQLGHSSVTTTESFYAHMIAESQAKAADCIADTLLRKKA